MLDNFIAKKPRLAKSSNFLEVGNSVRVLQHVTYNVNAYFVLLQLKLHSCILTANLCSESAALPGSREVPPQ